MSTQDNLSELRRDVDERQANVRRIALRVEEQHYITQADWVALVDYQQAMLRAALATNAVLLDLLEQARRTGVSLN